VTRRQVRVRAPGKVNLQLAVGAAGADGFHPLATVFQALDLYETVTATSRTDGQITLAMDTSRALREAWGEDAPAVPLDESNLAWRAAEAVRERYGVDAGVDLHILKGVPVAGGMAGGSADAAAAVVACAQVWDCGATRAELAEICAQLGSDVPFSLHGHTAVGMGRGDVLSPAMVRGEFHWVCAIQDQGLSTPAVFARWDAMQAERAAAVPEPTLDAAVMQALSAGDPFALGMALRNDLQDAALALAPHLEATMEAMYAAEALGVIVSGSGPTVVGLARSRQHALGIQAHVKAARVAAGVVTASGPTPGAVVVDDLEVAD